MTPRIALCHEWITTYGGSEQVAAHIAGALDIQDVFTFTADRSLSSRLFPGKNVRTVSRLADTSFGRRRWKLFLPVMPRAWRRLDLSGFAITITSAHSCVNAICPRGLHISYCHTPMRYAWEWQSEIGRIPGMLRPAWPLYAARLRRADRRRAQQVDLFIANSAYVADRIRRYYGKEAVVVHPPIDTDFWTPGDAQREPYFLAAGRLVAYKATDVVIDAAERAGVPLVVAGDGPELERLRALAGGADVRFIPSPSNEELRDLYRRAQALVFAGVEDFGMTLVEAQACGTPVIALREGGAREAVADGSTGHLYEPAAAEALAEVLSRFDPERFDRDALVAHAARFSVSRFRDEIVRHVNEAGSVSKRSSP